MFEPEESLKLGFHIELLRMRLYVNDIVMRKTPKYAKWASRKNNSENLPKTSPLSTYDLFSCRKQLNTTVVLGQVKSLRCRKKMVKMR